MGMHIRTFNWSQTPLGSPDVWPQSLKTTVSICLHSPVGMLLCWGEALTVLYNNAYHNSLGDRHTVTLGSNLTEVWPDYWPQTGPGLQSVFDNGQPVLLENQRFLRQRDGHQQACYVTFAFSPVYTEEDIIGGVLCTVTEVTPTTPIRQKAEESIQHFRNLILEAPVSAALLTGPDLRVELANEISLKLWGKSADIIGKPIREALPEMVGQPYLNILEEVYTTGVTYEGYENLAWLKHNDEIKPTYVNFILKALYNSNGDISSVLAMGYDVTNQVEARQTIAAKNEALEKLLEEFTFVTDSIPQMVWATRPDGYHEFFNKQWYDYTGLSFEEAKDTGWNNVLHPDDQERAWTVWRQSLQTGKPYEIAYRIRQHDGQYRWFLGRALPFLDNNGKISKWYGTCTDIHTQKSAEDSLKLQARILESMDEGVSVSDENGIILYTNAAEDLMFGYAPGELVGKHVTAQNAYPAGENEKIVAEVISTLNQDGSWNGEWHNKKKDGTLFFTFSRITTLELDSRKLLVCVQRDITRQKQTDEKLQIHSYILQHISDAIIFTGTDYTISSWNHEAEAMYGWPEKEVLGKYASDIIRTQYLNLQDNSHTWQQAIQTQGYWKGEVIQYKKDGSPLYILASTSVVKDPEGNVIGAVALNRDITERKKMEEALRLSKNHLQNILESISDTFISFDQDWNIVYVNQKAADILGTTPEELIGKNAWSVYPQEKNAAGYLNLLKAKETRQPVHAEYYAPQLNRWLEVRIYPTTEGVSVFSNDITERKQAEETLNYRKALLEAQNEAIPDAIIIVDTKGKILSHNRRFADLWGIPDEIIQNHDDTAALQFAMNQLVDPQEFIKRVNHYYNHPDEIAHEELLFKDGRIIERYGNAVIGEDGTRYGWAWYFRDVTQQRKAEQLIRENEMLLTSITNAAPITLWMTDQEGNISFVNQTWIDWTGHPLPDQLGKGWTEFIIPEDRPAVWSVFVSAFAERRYYKTDFRIRRADGRIQWCTSRGVPRYTSEGIFAGYVGSCTDITERKITEQELENKVRERTRELERSNDELQQFAYVASHDLQEPVRKIKTFADLLQRSALGADEQAASYLNRISASSDRMQSLIRDILNFSRLSNEENSYVSVDLNQVLADVTSDFELLISEKHARIVADHLPVIEAIPLQINQLFTNLINNSLKFSIPDRAPVIHISCHPMSPQSVQDNSELIQELPYVAISFADNGIGFNQQYAEQIFTIFQRLHDRQAYSGTGIGLALCRKIVANHHGSIVAMAEEGQGATFRILLPYRQIR